VSSFVVWVVDMIMRLLIGLNYLYEAQTSEYLASMASKYFSMVDFCLAKHVHVFIDYCMKVSAVKLCI